MKLEKKGRDRKKDKPEKDKEPIGAIAASCSCGWSRSSDVTDWNNVASAAESHWMLHRLQERRVAR